MHSGDPINLEVVECLLEAPGLVVDTAEQFSIAAVHGKSEKNWKGPGWLPALFCSPPSLAC
jgi:hypothetical protein